MKVRVTPLILYFVVCGVWNVARADRYDDIFNDISHAIDEQEIIEYNQSQIEATGPTIADSVGALKAIIGFAPGDSLSNQLRLRIRLFLIKDNAEKARQLIDEAGYHLFFGDLDAAESAINEAISLQNEVTEDLEEAFDYEQQIIDETKPFWDALYPHNIADNGYVDDTYDSYAGY